MPTRTVKEVIEAFDLLYKALHDREFRKSMRFNEWSEKELLPIVRSFLLGFFGSVTPEFQVRLPGTKSGMGRLDFLIDNVAVELAVRRPGDHKGPLSDKVNATEAKKLMLHDGLAVLVLFDFSKSPFQYEDLNRFRDWPSLGKGNHNRSAFNVSYHYIENARKRIYGKLYLNIRVQ